MLDDLRSNATKRPNVTALIIVFFLSADLWGSVPPGKADWRQGSAGLVLLKLVLIIPSESKVAEFDGALVSDENIGWLKVSVHDACRVQVLDCDQEVVDEGLGLDLINLALVVGQQFLHVVLVELHHEVNLR